MNATRIISGAALCCGAAVAVGAAYAQSTSSYPAKPIRIIAPFPAGGGYDFMARNIAQRLNEAWKEPVVVENRAGANGNIGSDAVAKSAPDGYTLLLGGIGPQALSVALYPRLPYDPLKDFEPVSLVAAQPNLLPDFREKAGVLGIELIGTPPERLTAHMKSEIARWVKVARAANIKLE